MAFSSVALASAKSITLMASGVSSPVERREDWERREGIGKGEREDWERRERIGKGEREDRERREGIGKGEREDWELKD